MTKENIQAFGGVKIGELSTSGAAGTIYLKDNNQTSGQIIINNNNISSPVKTLMLSNELSFTSINVVNQGTMDFLEENVSTINLEDSLFLDNQASFSLGLNTGLTVLNNNSFGVIINNQAKLTLDSGSNFTVEFSSSQWRKIRNSY